MVSVSRLSTALLYVVVCLPPSMARPTLPDIVKNYADAYALESSNWVSNVSTDPFYQTPPDMVSSFSPGDYIRFEEAFPPRTNPHSYPSGLTLYRLLYVSEDINNQSVPASAYVLVPYTSSSVPLQVIAWAHGLSGIQRQCAPSNQYDLYYSFEAPFAMALRGYLVVAPDYAGQGTDTPFNFLMASSHAVDISYAVNALRKAVNDGFMTYDWVAVGHNEGGSAVWALNEREADVPTGGFLGAVAIAPTLQTLAVGRHKLKNGLISSLSYYSYELSAIAQFYPFQDDLAFYTELGLILRDLARTACASTGFTIFDKLSFADVFRSDIWLNTIWALKWGKLTSVTGERALAQPMLLIQGSNPGYSESLQETFAEHCNHYPNSSVHLSFYPKIGYHSVAFVAQPEIFDWISDRFENASIPHTCTQRTVEMSPRPIIGNAMSLHVQD